MREISLNGSSEGYRFAENGQREEGLNFRVLAETIPHLVWSARADGISDYYNARFLEYLGRSMEEMQGWTWAETLHPEDKKRSIDAWTEAFTKGTEFCIEYRIRRGEDGRYLWHEGRAMPLRDTKGNIVRWFGTCTDIDEHKRLEELLRESESKFRVLHESIRDAFVCVGMNGQLLEFNSAYEELLGYTKDELLSKTYVDLTPAKWHDKEARIMTEQVIVHDYSEVYEKEYRRKDGTIVPIELRTFLIRSANGEPKFMWAIIRNITERKMAEKAMAKAKEAAEVANKAKSDFVANMSHEIRTPITSIMGMSELLSGTELSERQQNYVGTILTSTENLLALVNDILDLSKIEAGKVELERREFSLRGIIGEVSGSQISLAQAKGLSIKTDIPAGVPDSLTGDQLRLKQILLNLINNAIKFTERGEIALSVAVEEQQNNTSLLRFDVADTGIGISSEAITKIFNPFCQADSSMTRRFGGTGLGLAICTQLSALMEGEIWVDSLEGFGSTFHVRIPFAVSDAQPKLSGSRQVDQPSLWEDKPQRVLLVEDDESLRMLIAEMLKTRGHYVDSAKNGVEAVDKWSQGGYDLILMDVQMPVMDGIEAVGKIREIEREKGGHVPVIALTAHVTQKYRLKVRSEGFDGFVSKPMSSKDLFSEMKRCLVESGGN